uniref:Uncharacterized protein n=1 Tax=Moniliophthora roreri TaxID=221103 RepID=A0A0W0EYC7_MONRR
MISDANLLVRHHPHESLFVTQSSSGMNQLAVPSLSHQTSWLHLDILSMAGTNKCTAQVVNVLIDQMNNSGLSIIARSIVVSASTQLFTMNYNDVLTLNILVKPTAALGLSEASGGDGGNAVRDGINIVTIESITYIACQAFFMLTTHNTWSHTVRGFNIFAFYHNIITIFKAGPPKWQEDTLDWEVLQPANSIGDEPDEGLDMALALAQAAAEAAEAEAAAASNLTPSDPANGTQAT